MLILFNIQFLLVFSLHSEIFRHISDYWCFLPAELVTGSWHGGCSIPQVQFCCLAWLRLLQPRPFEDSSFCVLSCLRYQPPPPPFKGGFMPDGSEYVLHGHHRRQWSWCQASLLSADWLWYMYISSTKGTSNECNGYQCYA